MPKGSSWYLRHSTIKPDSPLFYTRQRCPCRRKETLPERNKQESPLPKAAADREEILTHEMRAASVKHRGGGAGVIWGEHYLDIGWKGLSEPLSPSLPLLPLSPPCPSLPSPISSPFPPVSSVSSSPLSLREHPGTQPIPATHRPPPPPPRIRTLTARSKRVFCRLPFLLSSYF